ncbi:MAG: hypothetical protein OXQ94_07195 [Gemmatimonadota bacterium]|nr:hypothetical protein [Gemmatimonadota bacterium]MDE2871461.1 hypothetical protein [Gemmatimonadota bacterium]
MNRGTMWSAIALLALLLAATIGEEPAGYWAPEGFVERANGIVARGGLSLRCGVQDSIVVALAPGSPDERFFRSSYLRADVRRFNDNPAAARSPFLADGCRLLGVDPFHHRVDLPYNRVPRWTGSVRFARADRGASFLGGRDQRLHLMHPLGGVGVTANARVDPGRRGAGVRTEFLRFEIPRTREIAAEAFFVGDGPVLADRRDVASTSRLRLDGFALPPGRIVRLETGDWVQMQHGGEIFTYLVEGSDRAELISTRGRGEGDERRHLVPRLAPFVGALGLAVEGGLQSTPSARDDGPVSRMDIRLTLDRELESAGQEVVNRWCERLRLRDRPRAASALIMDAHSGGVLAMPSCPGEPEVDEYRQLPRRLRFRYLRNQNLVAHPVGSALKPFWAAAVATAFPGMLDLELPEHAAGDVEDVFGCPLPVAYGSIGHGDWEGVETFIRTSCNRYMVEMATVALLAGDAVGSCGGEGVAMAECLVDGAAREAGAGEGRPVRFCDQVVNLVLDEGLPFTGDACGDLRLVDADFAPGLPLEGLTGAAAYRERAPAGTGPAELDEAYRAGRYRLDLWRDPIEALQAAGDTAHPTITALRFSAVSPQVTNLALNTVEELRTDWVNLLLGGENSRWSNFQLAEAMSRLMTGRDVRGRLVGRVGDGGLLSAEVIHPGARRRILHAMEMVARPGGTGARLAPALRRLEDRVGELPGAAGYEVYGFAKTGTPAASVVLGDGMAEREGSVVLLGLLVVPGEAGRAASRRNADWISACPVAPELRAGILGVPPAHLLNHDQGVGVSIAVYLDDLDPDRREASASALAVELMEPLTAYLAKRLERRLRREGLGSGG